MRIILETVWRPDCARRGRSRGHRRAASAPASGPPTALRSGIQNARDVGVELAPKQDADDAEGRRHEDERREERTDGGERQVARRVDHAKRKNAWTKIRSSSTSFGSKTSVDVRAANGNSRTSSLACSAALGTASSPPMTRIDVDAKNERLAERLCITALSSTRASRYVTCSIQAPKKTIIAAESAHGSSRASVSACSVARLSSPPHAEADRRRGAVRARDRTRSLRQRRRRRASVRARRADAARRPPRGQRRSR